MEVWDFSPPGETLGERSLEGDSMDLDVKGGAEGEEQDGGALVASGRRQ